MKRLNKHIQKTIEIFTESGQEASKSDFHAWIADVDHRKEKEEVLYDLWNKTDAQADQSTLDSLYLFKGKHQPKPKRINLIVWRYAAIIVFLLSITSAYYFSHTNNVENFIEYYSPLGKAEVIILPDGSKVHVNAGSFIIYSEGFGKTNRRIFLTGEANFQVVKNKSLPFVVSMKDYSVTALGTEFLITSYPEDPLVKTTLISGSIKISQPNKDDLFLDKNEQFVYNKQTQQHLIGYVDIQEATAWQRNELVFRSATIEEIINVLERQYSVVFVYDKNLLNSDKYSFLFKSGADLSEVMSVIKEVAGLKYEVKLNKHYIEVKK